MGLSTTGDIPIGSPTYYSGNVRDPLYHTTLVVSSVQEYTSCLQQLLEERVILAKETENLCVTLLVIYQVLVTSFQGSFDSCRQELSPVSTTRVRTKRSTILAYLQKELPPVRGTRAVAVSYNKIYYWYCGGESMLFFIHNKIILF